MVEMVKGWWSLARKRRVQGGRGLVRVLSRGAGVGERVITECRDCIMQSLHYAIRPWGGV